MLPIIPFKRKYLTSIASMVQHNPIEYLRGISHLRPRSPYYSTVYRIRDLASQSIHEYMHQHGCYYVHTPIITSNDCEGAGETFSYSFILLFMMNQCPSNIHLRGKGHNKESYERFLLLLLRNEYLFDRLRTTTGRDARLCSLQSVFLQMLSIDIHSYTFGPTFRAENSNSTRHLSEFWMVEPELMWADMKDIQSFAEGYSRFLWIHLHQLCKTCRSEGVESMSRRVELFGQDQQE